VMSIAVLEKGATTECRFYRLGVPWPAGTTHLAFQIWVALAITYYVAFVLELNAASSVGTGIFILVAQLRAWSCPRRFIASLGPCSEQLLQ
jgi:hypothetical protein